MNTIHKFHCPIRDSVELQLPRFAKVLCVQVQNEQPCIWAAVDTDSPKMPRKFSWRGTGHDISGLSNYVGSVQLEGGALVFHLFES